MEFPVEAETLRVVFRRECGGLRKITELPERVCPAQGMVFKERIVRTVIIAHSDLIRERPTQFLGIPFPSRSPEMEDGLRSTGGGLHPGVVSLFSVLDRVGGFVVVGGGSIADLRFNVFHRGEKFPMPFPNDRSQLSVGDGQSMETVQMGFDLLERLAEDRDGEQHVQADVRPERTDLGRERDRTLRALAVRTESTFDALLRDGLLRERDVLDEACDGFSATQGMTAIGTGTEGAMHPISDVVRLRRGTTERGRRARLPLLRRHRALSVIVLFNIVVPPLATKDHCLQLLHTKQELLNQGLLPSDDLLQYFDLPSTLFILLSKVRVETLVVPQLLQSLSDFLL